MHVEQPKDEAVGGGLVGWTFFAAGGIVLGRHYHVNQRIPLLVRFDRIANARGRLPAAHRSAKGFVIGRIGIDVITKELPVRASQFDKENRPILGPAASGNKAPERIPLSDLVVRDALAAGELLVSLPLAGQNMRRPAKGHDSLRFFEQRLDKGVKFAAFDYLGAGIVCGEHVESAEPIGHRAESCQRAWRHRSGTAPRPAALPA